MAAVNNDKFYTNHDLLDRIAQEIADLAREREFVDFSCGNNYLCKTLREKYGMATKSYDLDSEDTSVAKTDWFDVKDIRSGCVIGLNPPFGYQGALAKRFIQHAATFDPAYMFLILPRMGGGQWIPSGYRIRNELALPETSFYVPSRNNAPFSYATSYFVLEKDANSDEHEKPSPSKKRKAASVNGVTLRRTGPLMPDTLLIVRRVGVNCLHQCYVIDGQTVTYIENGVAKPNHDWHQNAHVVHSAQSVIKKGASSNPKASSSSADGKASTQGEGFFKMDVTGGPIASADSRIAFGMYLTTRDTTEQKKKTPPSATPDELMAHLTAFLNV